MTAQTHSERTLSPTGLSLYVSVRHSVVLSATSELNISETRPDCAMVTMHGLYKLAYGLSISHSPDDVKMVTSSFSFKMLLLRQFLSELDDTLTQCSPIWYVYMFLTDSRSGSYNVTDDVITYNHCRNFGAKNLGNGARQWDCYNGQSIETCLWAIDCA